MISYESIGLNDLLCTIEKTNVEDEDPRICIQDGRQFVSFKSGNIWIAHLITIDEDTEYYESERDKDRRWVHLQGLFERVRRPLDFNAWSAWEIRTKSAIEESGYNPSNVKFLMRGYIMTDFNNDYATIWLKNKLGVVASTEVSSLWSRNFAQEFILQYATSRK